MNILAIDTAETTAAAAITADERPIAEKCLTGTLTHSETMLPMILGLFSECGMTADDIDMFVCSAGPGSFTGVRIGVSVIKGLAFGRKRPDGEKVLCSGVSSVEALAYNLRGLPGGFIACPVMDARRGRFYNAMFSVADGKVLRLCHDRAVTAEELTAELDNVYGGKMIYLCGGGSQLALDSLKGRDNILAAPDNMIFQSGVSASVCAFRDYIGEKKYIADDITLSPFYLRPAQAEQKLFGV